MTDYGLNFRDMQIRVAEEAGLAAQPTTGTGIAAPPDTADELDRVKRAINDAIQEVIRQYPKWQCLRRHVSITASATADGAQHIDSDAGRIRVPIPVRLIPQGQWLVRATGADQTLCSRLALRSFQEVVALQATDPAAGQIPQIMGFGPLEVADVRGVRLGSEIRLWPRPGVDVVVTGMCRVALMPLVEDSDLSPMGADHDMLIVRQAVYQLHRRNPDLTIRAWHQQDAKQALAESMAIDGELVLPTLGKWVDGAESGDSSPYHGEQVYVNGTLMTSGA